MTPKKKNNSECLLDTIKNISIPNKNDKFDDAKDPERS